MKTTIWKFPLEITDDQSIAMPKGAILLSAMMQNGVLTLWALVQPSQPTVNRRVYVFGTGHPIPADLALEHVATLPDRQFIWHVFDGGEE